MGLAVLLQYPLILALLALVVVFLVCARVLGAFRTERDEARAGIGLLCAMRWNEFGRLVSDILKDRGMQPANAERSPGQDGFDFLFTRGKARYLVLCRNGANQTVTTQTVGNLHGMVGIQDADGAIIVSCAAAERAATGLANERRIEILADEDLWAHAKPWVAHDQRVDAEAVAHTAKRKRLLISALVAMLSAILTYSVVAAIAPAPTPHQPAPTAAPAAAKPAAPVTSTAPAMPDANLTDSQLASRRASATMEVRGLTRVASAIWSTRSTLQVVLHDDPSDAELAGLVDDVCRSLLQYEELRFTRLQVDVPTGDVAQPVRVRWRQCR